MKKVVQIEVAGSVYDVLGAVAKAIKDIKAAVKLGGNTEVPAIITALVADITPVLGQMVAMPADIAGDKVGAMEAALLQLPALIDSVTG